MASHIVLVWAGITTFDWISVLNDFIPPLWVSLSFPEIDPVFFRLGPLQFRWYGLMYLLGLLAAYFLVKHRAAARNIPLGTAQMSDLIVYAAFGVFLGGRLGYTLFYNTGYYLQNPLKILAIWEGGCPSTAGYSAPASGFRCSVIKRDSRRTRLRTWRHWLLRSG